MMPKMLGVGSSSAILTPCGAAINASVSPSEHQQRISRCREHSQALPQALLLCSCKRVPLGPAVSTRPRMGACNTCWAVYALTVTCWSSPQYVSLLCLQRDVKLWCVTSLVSIYDAENDQGHHSCCATAVPCTDKAPTVTSACLLVATEQRGKRQAAKGLKVNSGGHAPQWDTNYTAACHWGATQCRRRRKGRPVVHMGHEDIMGGPCVLSQIWHRSSQ